MKLIRKLFSFRTKKNQDNASNEINFLVSSAFKRAIFWTSIIGIIAFLLFIIIAGAIITLINCFNPFTNFGVLSSALYTAPGGFLESVISTVAALLYVFFISPILLILKILQDIVYFIASGDLARYLLFGGTDGWLGIPKIVFYVGGMATGLMVIIFCLYLAELMVVQNQRLEKLVSALKGLFLVFPVIFLIPIFFWIFNVITSTIAQVLILNTDNNVNDLGLLIFNSSFTDGVHNFTEVPSGWSFPGNENFGYLQCLIAEAFMAYILLQIVIFLFWNVAEQLILLVTGSFASVAMVKDGGKAFLNYKNIAINRLLSFSFMFLVYNIFLSGIPVLNQVGNLTPESVRPLFVTVGVIAFGLAVLKSPNLLSQIMGENIRPLNVGNRFLMTSAGLVYRGSKTAGKEIIKSPVTIYQGGTAFAGNYRAAKQVGFNKIMKTGLTKSHNESYKESLKKWNNYVGNKPKRNENNGQ